VSAARASGATGDSSAGDSSTGHLRVTQVRSGISTKPKHRGTLRALGLRGVGRSRVLPDRPDVRGMLARVPHLVTVQSADDDEATEQRERSARALRARRASHGDVTPDDAPAAATRPRRATKEIG
jgi:large subunit ribosomal protein L30